MSRLEANISLLIITFFSAIHYVFLAGVPETVSDFAFLCVTNIVGFVILFLFFFGELFRLDARQVLQSVILSAELMVVYVMTMFGVSGSSSTVAAAVLALYFVFVAAFSAVKERKFPDAGTSAGVLMVIVGLLLVTEVYAGGAVSPNIIYLVIADIAFAAYVMTTGSYASSSNPAILAMGQMFFCSIFSLLLWTWEVVFNGGTFVLPSEGMFWASVIYISVFMRGLFTIIQIYAQRYVSPLNTSLVFSTETIMTMAASPVLAKFLGTKPETITLPKVIGGVIMVMGILTADPEFLGALKRMLSRGGRVQRKREKFMLVIISCFVYCLMDAPVQMTGIFPSYAGIKNFLPATLGLFFGIYGTAGCMLGCALSAVILGSPLHSAAKECFCIAAAGLGMFYAWHLTTKPYKPSFKSWPDYVRYAVILLVLSAFAGAVYYPAYITAGLSYLLTGLFAGLPINILFSSLLYIEPVVPRWKNMAYDAEFCLLPDSESLEGANEILEEAAIKHGITMKRVLEIQSCIEELSIRIIKAQPNARISVSVIFGEAISARLHYAGEKYNPFRIEKDEDEIDIMSLAIIKHRAIRASFSYSGGVNQVHAVV